MVWGFDFGLPRLCVSSNPYQAPESEWEAEVSGRIHFADYTIKDLKKLYNHSRTIRMLVILWCFSILFSVLIIVVLTATTLKEGELIGLAVIFVWVVILAFQAITVYGTMKRADWGRNCAIIICSIMLLGFPMGTLVGALGLVALVQGKVLFGHDHLEFKLLKEEYKYRKKNKIP